MSPATTTFHRVKKKNNEFFMSGTKEFDAEEFKM